jgi:hypothetical protein
MGTNKEMPSFAFNKTFTVRFPDRSNWENGFVPDRNGGLILYTDGSQTSEDAGVGLYGG